MSSTRMKLMEVLNKSRKKPRPQALEAAKKKFRYNIVEGDKVQVIGKHPEKGKQGIVEAVLRDKDRLIVKGLNPGPRRIKGDPDKGTKGKTIEVPRSIHYSNVNLVDPVTGLPTRISKKVLEDGTKVRVAKRSGAIIPKPENFRLKEPKNTTVTESCTLEDDVWEITYNP